MTSFHESWFVMKAKSRAVVARDRAGWEGVGAEFQHGMTKMPWRWMMGMVAQKSK